MPAKKEETKTTTRKTPARKTSTTAKTTRSTTKTTTAKKASVKRATSSTTSSVAKQVAANARHIEENHQIAENNSKLIHILYGSIILLMIVIAGLAFYIGQNMNGNHGHSHGEQ